MILMRLFSGEKPSLGRAIAEVLPKAHKKGEGYISAANGDTVSWCIGHLLEQQLKNLIVQSLNVLPQGLAGLGRKSFKKRPKGHSQPKSSTKRQPS